MNIYSDLGVRYSSSINLDDRIPTLIPTHNATELLKYSFRIMIKSKCIDLIYPIIIDDRSSENIKDLCDEYNFGYIRIDHDSKFNYSINMNIGAQLLYEFGATTALFLNNDCYLHSLNSLNEFISRHYLYQSKLSGIKLVYPPLRFSFKKNIKNQNKIQFGGGYFNRSSAPDHKYRNMPLYTSGHSGHSGHNVDTEDTAFLTGACNLVELDDFIKIGMYDIRLPHAYQDVLLSLQYKKNNLKIYYIGKDIYFYHDESVTRSNDFLSERESYLNYKRIVQNENFCIV